MVGLDIGSDLEFSKVSQQCLTIAGHQILLIYRNNKYYAVDHRCPHKNASLCEAELKGNSIICPWHHAVFDISTGKSSGPLITSDLAVWPVSIENGRLFIHLPRSP